jgi:hypothetical protein
MAIAALDDFVKDALNRGATPDAIAAALAAAGWSKREVDDALAQWAVAGFGLAVPKPKTYVSAREAFLYIVMFALLGLVSFNLGSLLFALIDDAIADVLDPSTPQALHDQIRGALAALSVAAPLLAGFGWYIARERRANPAMQQSRVRKWLTYVTLMAAALVFVGDLIALVYSFLSGDLSERLLLKLIVVAVIAAGIFVFFLRDVEAAKPRGRLGAGPLLAALGAVAVVAAAVAGYWSIEDPIAVRELRLDDARLETMRKIAAAAQCAYNFTGRVPASYGDIRTAFEEERTVAYAGCYAVSFAARDESEVDYRADGPAHIRLCAPFLRASRESKDDVAAVPSAVTTFPELGEKRAAPGRHCYRIRMVKLLPLAPAEAPPDVPPATKPEPPPPAVREPAAPPR